MSLTQPATAAHSPATAIMIAILRFTGTVAFLARSTEFAAAADLIGRASILRNDRPPAFVVQTQRHDRIGAVDAEGKHAGDGIAANEPAEIVVAIFEFADQVVGDGVGDTAAGGQAAAVN